MTGFLNKYKRWGMAAGIICGVLILACVINFIPTWSLKTRDMHLLEGKWVNVWYETEEAAARDVFSLADAETEKLAQTLGFSEKQNVNIYVYDSQKVFQTKKYGLVIPFLSLDWYIGDNIGTEVILTSPANPGRVHDYDEVKYAVLHELVHAYVSVRNPEIALWLTEGMALYLTNGEPFSTDYLEWLEIPSYEDIQTQNPIKFSNMGGYTLAHTYIEYLDVTYGWDAVLELTATQQYEETLGKTEREIYEGWVNYIINYSE